MTAARPSAELRQGPRDGDVDLQLLDPATLGQLRTLNAAKKGDFLKRVVDLYSEHAPKACDQLRQHAKAGEAEACGALAHSLKSMSLNIGAIEVARMPPISSKWRGVTARSPIRASSSRCRTRWSELSRLGR